MLKCSIGVCVYNEEKNLEKLLDSALSQRLKDVKIDEIILVISGSTDNTLKIAKKYRRLDKRFKILIEKKRKGKASAVNLFIANSRNEILALIGGDLILPKNTVQKLVAKFNDPETGMTGAHPIPINDINSGFTGFAVNMLWELHHRVALKNPKMGEVVAFRKIFRRIPISSSVDEANIEPLIRGQGYLIKYVPQAVIHNKAPTKVEDFIKQRRRIYNGHLAVKYEQSYEVSTMSGASILFCFLSFLKDNPKPKFIILAPAVIALEAYSRFLGWWDYKVVKKKHTVWDIAETTKDL